MQVIDTKKHLLIAHPDLIEFPLILERFSESFGLSHELQSHINYISKILYERDQALNILENTNNGELATLRKELESPLKYVLLNYEHIKKSGDTGGHIQNLIQVLEKISHLLNTSNSNSAQLNNAASKGYSDINLVINNVIKMFTHRSQAKNSNIQFQNQPHAPVFIHIGSNNLTRILEKIVDLALLNNSNSDVNVHIINDERNTPSAIVINATNIEMGLMSYTDIVYEFSINQNIFSDSDEHVNLNIAATHSFCREMGCFLRLRYLNGKLLAMIEFPLTANTEQINDDRSLKKQLKFFASDLANSIRENTKINNQLDKTRIDALLRLAAAAEYKDTDTGLHVVRMGHYSAILAKELQFDNTYVKNIFYASQMHDIGKIAIPDSILCKKGKLDEDEWEVMKRHPEYGAAILGNSTDPLFVLAEEIALNHHEKFDGSGYPNKLTGTKIPISARIIAVADFFDAVTMDRCYRPAMSDKEALSLLEAGNGYHFDPYVIKAFYRAKDKIISTRTAINSGATVLPYVD